MLIQRRDFSYQIDGAFFVMIFSSGIKEKHGLAACIRSLRDVHFLDPVIQLSSGS